MFDLFSSPEKRFWKAIDKNDLSQIETLARAGVDVNTYRNPDGDTWTPLTFAAYFGLARIVELLLNLGANVDVRRNDGNTPLHLASSFRHVLAGDSDPVTVNLLIAHGANVNAVNRAGDSPLHLNALVMGPLKGGSFAESARLLVSRGANIRLKNKDGKTPFRLASLNNRTDIMEAIAARGNVEDSEPLLYWAVARENLPMVELLISRGVDVNTSHGSEGLTPLHCAALNSRISMIDALISKGAKVDACDDRGRTALHHLVTSNTREAGVSDAKPAVMERLIDHGANVNAKDRQGNTVLASLGSMEKLGGVWTRMGQILRECGART